MPHLAGHDPSISRSSALLPDLIHKCMDHPLCADLFVVCSQYFCGSAGARITRNDSELDTVIALCAEGSVGVQAGDQGTAKLLPGHIAIVPAGLDLTLDIDRGDHTCTHVLYVRGTHVAHFLHYIGGDVAFQTHDIGLQDVVVEEFMSIDRRVHSCVSISDAVCVSLEMAVLCGHLSEACQHAVREPNDIVSACRQCAADMERACDKEWNIKGLSLRAGMSVAHFSSKFRHEFGVPPIKFLISIRMRRACELLTVSGHSLKEIAALVGYPDTRYFSRVFHTVVGTTPSRYRRRYGWDRTRTVRV